MIEIVGWSKVFENADTRKRQRLGWFLAPSGCDSRGYRQLMRHGADGLIALGVFQALCQLMATLPHAKRGFFTNSDDTGMELADIWEMTRISPEIGEKALTLLVEIKWITVKSATCLPPVCQSHPAFVKGEGEGEGEEGCVQPENFPNGSDREPPTLKTILAMAKADGIMPAIAESYFDSRASVSPEGDWQRPTTGGHTIRVTSVRNDLHYFAKNYRSQPAPTNGGKERDDKHFEEGF